jgi:hypothetical protein
MLSLVEQDALDYLYGGDRDVKIECWSARWVITRCKQKCVSVLHKGPMKQPVGARMLLERAKVDGQFGSCYTCERCIKAASDELRRET